MEQCAHTDGARGVTSFTNTNFIVMRPSSGPSVFKSSMAGSIDFLMVKDRPHLRSLRTARSRKREAAKPPRKRTRLVGSADQLLCINRPKPASFRGRYRLRYRALWPFFESGCFD